MISQRSRSRGDRLDSAEKVWNRFTEYQKGYGLWLMGETEERWRQLIKKYPKIRHKEVYFESEKGLSNNTLI